MHYLASLSSKLVAAYKNQEKILNPTKRSIDLTDTRILSEALRGVLEQEVESGRLRYDLLHIQRAHADAPEQTEPFFEELLSHRG
jgi:hypothetical protein